MNIRLQRIALLATCAACGWRAQDESITVADRQVQSPTVAYRVICRPDASPPRWKVYLDVSGLSPADGPYELHLDDWGEWSEVDSLYLHLTKMEPSLRALDGAPGRFVVEPPEDWSGEIHVEYDLNLTRLGSQVQARKALLPTLGERYSLGYSINTLMQVRHDSAPIEAMYTLNLVAPAGWRVVTGFAGAGDARQTTRLERPAANGLIVFASPSEMKAASDEAGRYEVMQFGEADDITDDVLSMLQTLAPAMAASTGVAAPEVIRAFVVDNHGGGTRTDYGLRIGYSGGWTGSPYFIQFVAHELFHDWLGGALTPAPEAGDSLVWFFEGFTDYISLWHAAQARLVDVDWFAQRILELDNEARGKSSLGQVSFADPSVDWRDGDGPNETMAYKGGAMLAFHLDVALRQRGLPGVSAMIGDLLHETEGLYTLEDIRNWLAANDLSEFYERHFAGTTLPDAASALQSIGYTHVQEETVLTYFGLHTDNDTAFGRIVAIDPDGPAAGSGLEAGDVIIGYFPNRESRPLIDDAVTTSFRFGLDRVDPGTEGTFLDASRNGTEHRYFIDPELIPGGHIDAMRADPERTASFFEW